MLVQISQEINLISRCLIMFAIWQPNVYSKPKQISDSFFEERLHQVQQIDVVLIYLVKLV